MQMWVHAEAPIDDKTNLKNGDLALFVRVGSGVKNNYYEYEIPLELTLPAATIIIRRKTGISYGISPTSLTCRLMSLLI